MFQMVFVQIIGFDWLQGRQKGYILEKKMLKNLLLRNHKVDKAVTFRTCSWHYPLHKLCFCFGQVRTLVAMATFSLWLYLANSQMSVYRTIGPLVLNAVNDVMTLSSTLSAAILAQFRANSQHLMKVAFSLYSKINSQSRLLFDNTIFHDN